MRSNGDESHRALIRDTALLLMVQNKALLTHTDLIQVGPWGLCVRAAPLLLRSGLGVGKEGRTDWNACVSPPPTLVPG